MSREQSQSETQKSPTNLQEQLEVQADAFGLDTDPLAALEEDYKREEAVDPFEAYLAKKIQPKLDDKQLRPRTRRAYERTFEYWKQHMTDEYRHPACPNEDHVRRFIRVLRDEYEHTPNTIKYRIYHLSEAYKYWQESSYFLHPANFNPFSEPIETEPLGEEPPEKQQYSIGTESLREGVQKVTHLRDRTILLTQLKLGLRLAEVRNLRLEDIALEHNDLQCHYETLGTHDWVANFEDAVYIAPQVGSTAPVSGREGNKSASPRVLPIDDELRQLLIQYLLIRPDSGEPWVFQTKKNHTKLRGGKAINQAWKKAFHPEYTETDRFRAVTSHYGRHRFVTHWRDAGLHPEELKYMRGDDSPYDIDSQSVLNQYIWKYYSDIKDVYLENVEKLRI